jgi:hypothetical protein
MIAGASLARNPAQQEPRMTFTLILIPFFDLTGDACRRCARW